MNRSIARALFDDAFHQVLDNRIFRLLLLVVLVLVAPTFLIGFREHDVQILWGWQQVTYEDLFAWFGHSAKAYKSVQAGAIQGYQRFVVDGLCGSIGMIFCVAATAFFVPRMLEKGSADVLFSKPVSRATLLFARYLSGILFVAILAGGLVLGMYVGFLVVSGYGDAGFLWGALTLVYLFAIVHAVATLAGVMTRSTVAATLIALVFFMGSGCVHQAWRIRTFIQDKKLTSKLRESLESNAESDTVVPTILEEDPGTFVRGMLLLLDSLHYTLPKTSDADLITRKLRRAIERRDVAVVDETIHLTIPAAPIGFDLLEEGLPPATVGGFTVDLSVNPVTWSSTPTGGGAAATVRVSRRTRVVERAPDPGSGAKARPRRLTASSAADEVIQHARDSGRLESEPTTVKGKVDGAYAIFVAWDEKADEGTLARQAVEFVAGDWIVEATCSAPKIGLSPEERKSRFEEFVGGFQIARTTEFEDPSQWYERRFAWTAPLPYNVFFSIGTSIVFTLLALGFATWRLRRIEF
jgi:ABC-type transport system involved in multi-copper enzyme maturation permease subunit